MLRDGFDSSQSFAHLGRGCRIPKLSTELRNPLRIGALRASNLQFVLACECHLLHASVRRRRTCTASPFSSRSASAAIHRAAREFCLRIFSASRMAARFSRRFRFPMFRKAQFTAFLTKFRSSWASREIIGSSRKNFACTAVLSRYARYAISANPARLMNSSLRPLRSIAFFQAGSAKTNRWQQVPSHTSQLSKSRTQRSICFDVTCSATSIIPARIRASCTPVSQSSSASSSIFGFATPYTAFARIPYRAMPSIFRCSPRERSSRNARAQFHFSLGTWRMERRLECFVGVEEDRDRAFIDQLHGHHRLKNSGRHSHTEFAKRRAKFIIQGFSLLGRSRRNKARPPLPACIAVKRELRDN